MPIMNGFELYKEIRKLDEQVKICFINAYEIDGNDFTRSSPTMTQAFYQENHLPRQVSKRTKRKDKRKIHLRSLFCWPLLKVLVCFSIIRKIQN